MAVNLGFFNRQNTVKQWMLCLADVNFLQQKVLFIEGLIYPTFHSRAGPYK